MKQSILLGLSAFVASCLTAGTANAQFAGFGHKHHKHHFVAGGFAPLAVQPLAVQTLAVQPMLVQPMAVQPVVAGSALSIRDILDIIGSIPRPGGGGSNGDLDARITSLQNRVAALEADMTTVKRSVTAFENTVEENRRTRILVEQHDEVLKQLWNNRRTQ